MALTLKLRALNKQIGLVTFNSDSAALTLSLFRWISLISLVIIMDKDNQYEGMRIRF